MRWCDSTALTNCQSKYVGSFKYPRFSNPNGGVVAAYGTITIGTSASAGAIAINSVSVAESGGTVVITNSAVTAATGTDTVGKQATVATALAASIIAKTGLTNQYLACVRTPVSGYGVPACSTYGITLGTDNVVAVVPIDCASGTSSKSIGVCSVLTDSSRSGWAITVDAPATVAIAAQPATALITVSGTASNSKFASSRTVLAAGTKLGGTTLIASDRTFGKSASSTSVASTIAGDIGTQGSIAAYLGGNAVSQVCAAKSANTICDGAVGGDHAAVRIRKARVFEAADVFRLAIRQCRAVEPQTWPGTDSRPAPAPPRPSSRTSSARRWCSIRRR
ncbi:hypothetical protein [Massilia phosphatilytica]